MDEARCDGDPALELVGVEGATAWPYPGGWVRRWYAATRALRAWGGPVTAELHVRGALRIPRRLGGPVAEDGGFESCGEAWPIARRVGVVHLYAGTSPASALATLLHEMAHVAAGPFSGHGPAWRRIFASAVHEVTGTRPRWSWRARGRIDVGALRAVVRMFDELGHNQPP